MNNSPISCTRKNDRLKPVILLICLIATFLFSLCAGAASVRPSQLLQALFSGDSQSLAGRILHFVRLPRALCAMVAGGCLALSGCLLQSVLANPLAAPHMLGINAGAGLAVILMCAFLPAASGWLPLAAFVGATMAAITITALGEALSASRLTIILCGVMLTALLNAAIDAILSFVPDAAAGYVHFRIGSFSGVSMNILPGTAIPFLVLLVITLSLSTQLQVLSLGDTTASGLGLSIRPIRFLFLMIASALAGIAVSIAGTLGFVGLIVPHIAQRMIKTNLRSRLLFCTLGGALLTLCCDTLARLIAAPYELPVGIFLSALGAPFFLWLLIRQRGGRNHA